MKYTADDLQPIGDPVAYVRDNPERFLAGGVANLATIATDIAMDALVLGARDTRVFWSDQWWIIQSDFDWLHAACRCPPSSPQGAFTRLLGFPELAANSFRHEILATAFADCVASCSPNDRFIVVGNIPDTDTVWDRMLTQNVLRAVALRASRT